MASHASDRPHPAVVEIDPGEYSSATFWAFVDEMLARPEPALENIGAAELCVKSEPMPIPWNDASRHRRLGRR